MPLFDKSQRHLSAPLCVQVDKYKYLVWVPGNCASVRLAIQLASDAAVLKVINHDSVFLSLAEVLLAGVY